MNASGMDGSDDVESQIMQQIVSYLRTSYLNLKNDIIYPLQTVVLLQ